MRLVRPYEPAHDRSGLVRQGKVMAADPPRRIRAESVAFAVSNFCGPDEADVAF